MITKRENIGAQGEISIFRCEGEMPKSVKENLEKDRSGRPIVSHSESGNHHILDSDVALFEKEGTAVGMRIFYALLDEPASLIQDAPDAHGSYDLSPGLYEFRIAREYDPFSEQIRQVAD